MSTITEKQLQQMRDLASELWQVTALTAKDLEAGKNLNGLNAWVSMIGEERARELLMAAVIILANDFNKDVAEKKRQRGKDSEDG